MNTIIGQDWLLSTNPDTFEEAQAFADELYLNGYCIEHDEEFDPEADDERGCRACELQDITNEQFQQYWSDVL